MTKSGRYARWLLASSASVTLVTLAAQSGQSPKDGAYPARPTVLDADAGWVAPTPSDFGIRDEGISTVQGFAFRERESATEIDGDLTGGRWVTGGPPLLYAPLPDIPNGADITQVAFYILDVDPVLNFQGRLCRHWTDSGTGANPGSDCPLVISSNGIENTQISGDPETTALYRFDLDSDMTEEVVSYTLSGNWNGNIAGTIRLRQARVLWRRQVSPDPAFATFADVPLGHPQHRFVEAMTSAGLTGGCGGGNYCPDAPVTRGQLAVFLSAALGLHWPAF